MRRAARDNPSVRRGSARAMGTHTARRIPARKARLGSARTTGRGRQVQRAMRSSAPRFLRDRALLAKYCDGMR
jgi:hypothetical protein